MKSPKQPTPTNPQTVIQQQNQQNDLSDAKQQTANRVDQTNALGSQSNWSYDGIDPATGQPKWSQSTTYGATPSMYASGLAGIGQQYFQGANDRLNQDPSSLNSDAAMKQATDWATQEGQRQYGIQRDRLDNQLKNQGLVPGTEAYNNAMQNLDLTNQRNIAGTAAGVQNQFFNEGQTAANNDVSRFGALTSPGVQFGNQALNLGFSSVPGINVGTTNASQIYQNYDQQQMDAYKAQLAQYNAMLGGLGGIGGSLLMAPMTGGTSLGGMMLGGLGNMFKPSPTVTGYGNSYSPIVQQYGP